MSASPEAKTWTIGSVIKWATDDFRSRGIDNPRLDAELLVAKALGTSRMQLIVDAQRPLEGEELSRLRELVKRRRVREPVAYILGEREFYGRMFRVDARVLVPRPDTETLVEVALARTADCSMSMRALDLCTGSGCVAITLARQRPTASVCGADISEGAVALARENAMRLGAHNAYFVVSDLFERVDPNARFDVITANPPYIPTAEVETLDEDIKAHEPRIALDGGADGLSIARRIVAEARAHLAPSGVLAMEVGQGQAPLLAAELERHGYTSVQIARDYGKIERVVSAAAP